MKFVNLLLRQIVTKNPNKAVDLELKPVTMKILQTRLRKGSVVFMFKKTNGTIRIAQGTLQMDKVPSHLKPLGLKEPTPAQLNYFDLTKNMWRSISSNSEIFLSK